MNHFIGAYRKYADFTGRARRKEYWMFYLFYFVAIFILAIIDNIIGSTNQKEGFGLIASIFILASFVPALAVAARRLHDTNRSGWWQLIMIIPVLGSIVLLIFFVLKGDEGENRFGEDPLESVN